MSKTREELKKRYYSISEVASMFDVSTSLIRYWETEFDDLKPYKNSKGDRRFTPDSIEQFGKIYTLVKERGFTLSGAKQELKQQKDWEKKKAHILSSLTKIRSSLVQLKHKP